LPHTTQANERAPSKKKGNEKWKYREEEEHPQKLVADNFNVGTLAKNYSMYIHQQQRQQQLVFSLSLFKLYRSRMGKKCTRLFFRATQMTAVRFLPPQTRIIDHPKQKPEFALPPKVSPFVFSHPKTFFAKNQREMCIDLCKNRTSSHQKQPRYK